MKTLTKLKRKNDRAKKCLLSISVASLVSTSASNAAILITIDASDISAVVFTAVGNGSLVDDMTSHTGEGVTMRSLFEVGINVNRTVFTGTFKAGSSPLEYTSFTNQEVGLNTVDLNVSTAGPDTHTQNFSMGDGSFLGAMTLDLTGSSILAGSSGNIIAGYGHAPSPFGSASNAVIGEWQVVPEPSSALLVTFSGVLLSVRRKR